MISLILLKLQTLVANFYLWLHVSYYIELIVSLTFESLTILDSINESYYLLFE